MFNLRQWCIENRVPYKSFIQSEGWQGEVAEVEYEVINLTGKEHLCEDIEFLNPRVLFEGSVCILLFRGI